MKIIKLIFLILLVSGCQDQNRWDPSYAKLNKYQQEAADICSKKTGWNEKGHLVSYMENEMAGHSIVTINYNHTSFVKCHFPFQSTEIGRSEHHLMGKVVREF